MRMELDLLDLAIEATPSLLKYTTPEAPKLLAQMTTCGYFKY
jgi:hypothetical protein